MAQKTTTYKESLLYSVVIFCWIAPVMFLWGITGDIYQLLNEGAIWRGGMSEACAAVDFDPKYGQSCDGVKYIEQPHVTIPFTQALAEHSVSSLKLFFGLVPFGLFFGHIYYQQEVKNKKGKS